jgi:ubiquinol-cytochrome c reductase cytochrome c1 subunit
MAQLATIVGAGAVVAFVIADKDKKQVHCWSYRDDVGSFWGIKGYEEQVTEVGTHHGHLSWPQYRFLGSFDAGSVRRGFQVFARNCANCHGMFYKKYDHLLDKAYKQLELAAMVSNFTINPAHHHFKQYYYQEWDDRERLIHDRIYAPYYSQDQAKNANGGVWPTDLSKIRLRPGGVNYIYNILTGYHYKPPYGIDIPKGKSFNPYFDHMIIGMPRQLYDGMIDYDDGTPASAPQMAFDVSNFVCYMQRRAGAKKPDKMVRNYMFGTGFLLLLPFAYMRTRAYFRNLLSVRWEMYAVRDGVYYNHFKKGGRNSRAYQWRNRYWA